MEKELGKEYPPGAKRIAFLKDNCEKVEEKGYMRAFGNEKIQGLKDELAEKSIEISELEAAKKAATIEFNAELKPLKERSAEVTKQIKERAEYVKEECFKFVDEEAREVGYYNREGNLVESRPAHPGEIQQTNILRTISPLKTGTDNI